MSTVEALLDVKRLRGALQDIAEDWCRACNAYVIANAAIATADRLADALAQPSAPAAAADRQLAVVELQRDIARADATAAESTLAEREAECERLRGELAAAQADREMAGRERDIASTRAAEWLAEKILADAEHEEDIAIVTERTRRECAAMVRAAAHQCMVVGVCRGGFLSVADRIESTPERDADVKE